MSKRRQRGEDTNDVFGELGGNTLPEPSTGLTTTDIANAAYGTQVVDPGRRHKKIRAIPTHIFEIIPDATQPRRTIPASVRHYWNGAPDGIPHLLEMWLKEINALRPNDNPFAIDTYLLGEASERAPADFSEDDETLAPFSSQQKNPKEAAFLQIVDLAASIYRDGLTNPITVAKKQSHYAIETGERRWLAYHVLCWRFGDEWSQIPARLVDGVSIWRQASENNARDNLNAIGKARQFALLLMDRYGLTNFDPLDSFHNEQDFYAQVADGNEYAIPRGEGETFLNAMGFKDKSQYRRHRDLLRLPVQVWEWADELNWTEGRIRSLRSKAQNEDELILLAAVEAEKEGLSVPIDTHHAKQKPEKPIYEQGHSLAKADDKARFKFLMSLGTKIGDADHRTRQDILDEIEAAEIWLQKVKSRLS